jgi:hypothetical protein
MFVPEREQNFAGLWFTVEANEIFNPVAQTKGERKPHQPIRTNVFFFFGKSKDFFFASGPSSSYAGFPDAKDSDIFGVAVTT